MRTPSLHTLDILALGRTYVNLEGQQISPSIKNISTFKKQISGLSALVSIGLARLDLSCALLAQVGNDPLGEYIREILATEKIDPTLLITHPQQPTLIAFNNHIFFEQPSLTDLPEHAIDPGMISHAKALFLTGELFTLEASNHAARKAIIAAKENRTKIILVLDKHNIENGISSSIRSVLPFCDLIFAEEKEWLLFANVQNLQEALMSVHSLTHATMVVKGETQCCIFDENLHSFPIDAKTTVSSLNEYAAFITGFIHAWLQGKSATEALAKGQWHEQLAKMSPQHLQLPTQAMQRYIDSHQEGNTLEKITQSPYFKHLHYSSTRSYSTQPKFLLNFGYHEQWQKFAEPFAIHDDTLQKAKMLLAEGIFAAHHQDFQVGIISDDNPPHFTLNRTLPAENFLARTVELPNQIPLKLAFSSDITRSLIKWSTQHTVKVAVTYHPDDRYNLRGEQEAVVAALHQACRETDHALIIEIAPPANSIMTASTIGHIIQRFYSLQIYPDNWQFAPPRDPRSWESIQRVIQEYDPKCTGALVHTPLYSLDHFNMLFDVLAKQPVCHGIVIGKNIFHPLLEQWFSQKIADHIFMDQVRALFEQIVAIWKNKLAVNQKEDSVLESNFI